MFDNVSLRYTDEPSRVNYTYYDSGLVKSAETELLREYYTYDSDDNITSMANNRRTYYEYFYNDAGLLYKTVRYEYPANVNVNSVESLSGLADVSVIKAVNENTYNAYGQCTESKTYTEFATEQVTENGVTVTKEVPSLKEGAKTVSIKTEYSESPRIFGAVISIEDNLSVVTRMFYDENNGRLLASVNLDTGEGTVYTYDNAGRVIMVRPATVTASGSNVSYAPISDAYSVSYSYNGESLISSITTESTVYSFSYGLFGEKTEVKAGNNTLATYEYAPGHGKLSRVSYGNGYSESYYYNDLEKLEKICYTVNGITKDAYSYVYTDNGSVSSIEDHINEKVTYYTYDTTGKLVSAVTADTGDDAAWTDVINYTYDPLKGKLTAMTARLPVDAVGMSMSVPLEYTYSYMEDSTEFISSVEFALNFEEYSTEIGGVFEYSYDDYDRLWGTYISIGDFYCYTDYVYSTTESSETHLVEQVVQNLMDDDYIYTDYLYDGDRVTGIITTSDSGDFENEIYYYYDDYGQLIREDNWYASETFVYTYDSAGNITSKITYSLTYDEEITDDPIDVIVYGYSDGGWGDLLTSFEGSAITYDQIGNPTQYRGYSFTWTGRQLTGATKGNNTYSFTYNSDGIRTSKTVNGVTTNYYLNGSTIIAEETEGNITVYLYDASGMPIGMMYHGSDYYMGDWDVYGFILNLQGDVVSVFNTDGEIVLNYYYDALGYCWAEEIEETTASGNHLTYRGYYYDTDLGLYYLNSRYYDPYTSRFISADSVIAGVGGDLKGYNLFAYCFNNPVNMDDQDGNWPKWIKNTVKWVAKNIVKPVVKTVQKTLSKVDLTYSTGVNVSGTPGAWIFNGQIGLSMDTKGNVAIQASGGGGITGGNPGISITRYQSVTNAPNIDKLNDAYYQVGGSIAVPIEDVPIAVGGDVMFMPDPALNTGYFGLTGNVGFCTPGKEFHVEWGTTVTLPYTQFNIYEVARFVYIKIMEW